VFSESCRTFRTCGTLSAAAPQPVFVTLTIDAFNARGHLCCLVHLNQTRVVASRSIMSSSTAVRPVSNYLPISATAGIVLRVTSHHTPTPSCTSLPDESSQADVSPPRGSLRPHSAHRIKHRHEVTVAVGPGVRARRKAVDTRGDESVLHTCSHRPPRQARRYGSRSCRCLERISLALHIACTAICSDFATYEGLGVCHGSACAHTTRYGVRILPPLQQTQRTRHTRTSNR
jgi:hypothetical protein